MTDAMTKLFKAAQPFADFQFEIKGVWVERLQDALPAAREEWERMREERERFKRLDREAASHVESVICMRSSHFTGEEPYVGWRGLGKALREDYDELARRRSDLEAALATRSDLYRQTLQLTIEKARLTEELEAARAPLVAVTDKAIGAACAEWAGDSNEVTEADRDRMHWALRAALPHLRPGRVPDGMELHPDTAALVCDFAADLAAKLKHAQGKYGYGNKWKTDEWQADCHRAFFEHIAKGDPIDVAAYCAFMWARGWSTATFAQQPETIRSAAREACAKIADGHRNAFANEEQRQAYNRAASSIASRIRARSETGREG